MTNFHEAMQTTYLPHGTELMLAGLENSHTAWVGYLYRDASGEVCQWADVWNSRDGLREENMEGLADHAWIVMKAKKVGNSLYRDGRPTLMIV